MAIMSKIFLVPPFIKVCNHNILDIVSSLSGTAGALFLSDSFVLLPSCSPCRLSVVHSIPLLTVPHSVPLTRFLLHYCCRLHDYFLFWKPDLNVASSFEGLRALLWMTLAPFFDHFGLEFTFHPDRNSLHTPDLLAWAIYFSFMNIMSLLLFYLFPLHSSSHIRSY